MVKHYIKSLKDNVGSKVVLKGWASNIRSGKGIYFILMRDGTGFCQVVVSQESVSNEVFEAISTLTQESSFWVEGTVIQDEKQVGGYEIQATDAGIYHIAEEYPISNKEHMVLPFLSNNRHLWLRSRKQWAIMSIRNEIIMAIHGFSKGRFLTDGCPDIYRQCCRRDNNFIWNRLLWKSGLSFSIRSAIC
jgi:asparaginyl-tRNA synthetase